jgi:hypothetical protein
MRSVRNGITKLDTNQSKKPTKANSFVWNPNEHFFEIRLDTATGKIVILSPLNSDLVHLKAKNAGFYLRRKPHETPETWNRCIDASPSSLYYHKEAEVSLGPLGDA